jgi:hypothetical protein
MKAECAALRSKEKKISPSGTRLLRLALIWGREPQNMDGRAYSLLEAVYRLPLRASTAFSHSLRRSARFRSLFSKAYQNLNRRMKPLRSSTVC